MSSRDTLRLGRHLRGTAPHGDPLGRMPSSLGWTRRSSSLGPKSAVAAVALLLLSPTATAYGQTEEARVALEWSAPDALCPGTEDAIGRVEVALERRAFVEGREEADFEIRVAIGRNDVSSTWSSSIRLSRDGEEIGIRELRSAEESCDEIAHQTAFAIALMIDLEVERQTEVEASPPEPAPAEADPFWLQLSGLLDFNITSAFGMRIGIMGSVFVRFGSLDPFIASVRMNTIVFSVETDLDGGLRAEQFAGGLGYCPTLFATERVGLNICGGIEAGGLLARGERFAVSMDSSVPVFNLNADVRLWWKFWWRFLFIVSAEASLSLIRPVFTVLEPGGSQRVVLEGDRFGGSLRFGFGLIF